MVKEIKLVSKKRIRGVDGFSLKILKWNDGDVRLEIYSEDGGATILLKPTATKKLRRYLTI